MKKVAKMGTVSYAVIALPTLCSWSAVTVAFAFIAVLSYVSTLTKKTSKLLSAT